MRRKMWTSAQKMWTATRALVVRNITGEQKERVVRFVDHHDGLKCVDETRTSFSSFVLTTSLPKFSKFWSAGPAVMNRAFCNLFSLRSRQCMRTRRGCYHNRARARRTRLILSSQSRDDSSRCAPPRGPSPRRLPPPPRILLADGVHYVQQGRSNPRNGQDGARPGVTPGVARRRKLLAASQNTKLLPTRCTASV